MEERIFELLRKFDKGIISLTNEEKDVLISNGYIKEDILTNKANRELKKHKVKRAIIIGAGFGSRMVPVTLTTPKPLVKVNGVSFIESIIDHLLVNDIKDITIVVGYLGDKFYSLKEKYPFIKIVHNNKYEKENNVSSAYLVRNKLKECYLCEADLLVTGDNVFNKYEYESNYLGTFFTKTDDWCFDMNNSGYAVNYRKGGNNCYQAYGISYWSKKDGKLLSKYINKMYIKDNHKDDFWELSVFKYYPDILKTKIRLIDPKEIIEVDSFDELKALDSSYNSYK